MKEPDEVKTDSPLVRLVRSRWFWILLLGCAAIGIALAVLFPNLSHMGD